MLKNLFNIIIPHRCICNNILFDYNADLCAPCWNKIEFVGSNICAVCGDIFEFEMGKDALCANCISNKVHFDTARAVFKYGDGVEKLITGLKYMDRTFYSKILTRFMVNKLSDLGSVDIITSVPMHNLRLLRRKYNQSALLANYIANRVGSRANNMLLLKNRNIPAQASLSRKDRIKNVQGAIKINTRFNNGIKDKNILLVDDVMTTGATANECAKILKSAGAAKVYVLTAARTVLDR